MQFEFSMYLIKMGTEGIIVLQDLEALSCLVAEINKIEVNINQIAHKTNFGSVIMTQGVEFINRKLENIYDMIQIYKLPFPN